MLIGGQNSNTKCSMTFVNIAVASSQVASNPLGDHFRTQIWVLKWNLQGGVLEPNFFWPLFRFWVLKWVLKWYLPPLKNHEKHPKLDILDDALMRQTLQHLHFL